MIPPRKSSKTKEEKIIDKGDKLYPQLRYGRCCIPCLIKYKVRPAENIRLVYNTKNPLVRFDLQNLIPVCEEHFLCEENEIPVPQKTKEHLLNMNKKTLEGVAIARGKTKEQVLEELVLKIKRQIL